MGHARLSPSAASRWMTCPGSVVLSEGIADTSSEFADEGTAAHYLAAVCLSTGNNAKDYLHYEILLCENKATGEHFECFKSEPELWADVERLRAQKEDGIKVTDFVRDGVRILNSFQVDYDMVGFVQAYVDRCRDVGGELFVEQRLSISHLTLEEDAYGTSDAVIVAGAELVIRDLKYGRGVKVDAENNQQLQIYALAALEEFSLLYDIQTVRMCIDQPRLGHVSEWVQTVDQLNEFADEVRTAASKVEMAARFKDDYEGKIEIYLKPSDDACTFCKAKADCPALRRHVLTTVADDFVDETQDIAPQLEHAKTRTMDNALLGNLLSSVDLIEGFCKAIRAKAEAEMFAGREVPGYKLVQGRKGHRAWVDPAETEKVMKSMRLKVEEMYDLSLISPTTAEKLQKAGVIGPRQWPKLQDLITQPDGKPSVAPASDKRPALVIAPTVDDFDEEIDDLI